MNFPRLDDVNLEPLWEEEINHKVAIKHALLFSTIEGVKSAIVEKDTLSESLKSSFKTSFRLPYCHARY